MAVDPAVAELIREVLAEELALLKRETREERVRIADDADLAAFAKRVLALVEDRDAREAFESGSLVFRLDAGAAGPADSGRGATRGASAPGGRKAAAGTGRRGDTVPAEGAVGGVMTLRAGLFSERQAASLPRGTASVRLGRNARLTPLARDRLRRRGITIERTET